MQDIKSIQQARLIVIIDDSDIDIMVLKHTMKIIKSTAEVISFNFPLRAMEYLIEADMNENQSRIPDLIFLDINMPNMNGFQFIEAFDKLSDKTREKTRFIITTSSNNEEDRLKAKDYSHVLDYIEKPVIEEKLTG
jgi:response regulator RpfG family c-di-GMP phosphodiesterase